MTKINKTSNYDLEREKTFFENRSSFLLKNKQF